MLVGRAAEQRRLEELLGSARAGSSATLVLVGDPGIGKTALLEHAAAAATGFEVLRARGVQSEAELPFATLLELCRPLLGRLDQLAPPQAAALRAAFGLVERETPRFAVGAATLSLLAAAAEEQPLLLLVDDAHWADRGSAEALTFALRRLRADRVAAVIAMRPGEGRAFERHELPELELRGLDEASAAELFDAAAGAAVADEVRREVLALARGNPLALLELPRHAEPELLAAEPLRLGKQLERGYAARAEELPDATRRALLVAAVASTTELEVLHEALARLEIDARALEPAETAELVAITAGTLQFRHPLVRSALYHAADAPDRRRAHAAVAAALGDDERAAWHLAAAAVGRDEAAARALDRAADTARRRSGYAAAAAAYERAARLSEQTEERVRRLAAGADAAWLGGRAPLALAMIDEALAHAFDPLRRGALLHTRGAIEHFGGNVAAQQPLEEAAELLAGSDPRQACAALTTAVGSALMGGDVDRAVSLSGRLYELADLDSPDQQLFAALSRGAALLMAGRPEEGLPILRRAHATVADGALFADEPRHLSWAALAAFWLGDIHAMAGHAERALDWAREHAAIGALPHAARLLARAELILGRWRAAHASLAQSLEAARITRQSNQEADTLAVLAWLDAVQGRADDCRRHVEQANELTERRGNLWRNGQLHALVVLELGLGVEPESPGVARFRRAIAEQPLRDTPANSTVPDLVEALVRLGETEAAEALLEPFAAEAERIGQTYPRATALRCRGLLARDGDYEHEFERSLELHAEDPNVFAAARTRLAYGERLRRSGRRIDAREELRAALGVFERLEAAPWTERALSELRATGERLRARSPATAVELTAHELQIALLVCEGKTNREVGTRLFLSPKTIEWHLGHVYRKLGVRSRAELVRALETSPAAAVAVP